MQHSREALTSGRVKLQKQASSKSASNEAAMETDAQGGENAAHSRDPADKTPTNSSSSEDDNA